jgi:diguanylate cyclase (GGDEF)-like protein
MKLTILVADDELSTIEALMNILEPKYTLLVARNGMAALNAARTQTPDLILLSIALPDMTGFDAIIELKRSDLTRSVPVIIISGRDHAKDEEMSFFLGAVDFIKKPFHNSVLLARIKTHLQMAEYIRMIERLGMLDALTNIPNRRSFSQQFNKEWDRAVREKTSISILMMDIDRFKKYNDQYGHMQGDVLLQAVAGVFKLSLKRPADFVARWGGEEFVVLLPNTDSDGAMEVAEQIRKNVASTVVSTSGGIETHVTISIGVNSIGSAAACLPADFITDADTALYKAKESGRDRVCLFISPNLVSQEDS